MSFRCILPLLLLLCATPSFARTWFVEKDGSGDYAVIQEAVDAAADGDTVRVGPGVYSEYRLKTSGSWTTECYVDCDTLSLVLLGAGEETILRPETPYDFDESESVAFAKWAPGTSLTISRFRIEGIERGTDILGPLTLSQITAVDCGLGAGVSSHSSGSTQIADCTFDSNLSGLMLFGNYGGSISVSRCSMRDNRDNGLYLAGASGVAVVQGCVMTGSHTGAAIYEGTVLVLRDCEVRGRSLGLFISGSCNVSMQGCKVWGGEQQSITSENGSTLTGTGNVILGSDIAHRTIDLHNSNVIFTGNHIHKGVGPVIEAQYSYPTQHTWTLDFRDNYWGTVEADSIAAWILDSVDNPEMPATVDYLPFSAVPVETERRSLGSVKSLFR